MRKFWMGLAGLALVGSTMAAETPRFYPSTTVTAPALGGGDGESLTSMRKNGKITIGGDLSIMTSYAYVHDSNGIQIGGNTTNSINETRFEADEAHLDFRVDACPGVYLFLKLDLNDGWKNNGFFGQDALLEEAYFGFENLCNSGLAVKFGKQEVPFGMDKDDLLVHPYLDDYSNTPLGRYWLETGHSVNYDRRFAIVPSYKLNEKFEIELALFQDTDGRGLNVNNSTSDPILSYAARATFSPISDLKLIGSFVSRNNTSNLNDPLISGIPNLESRARMYATSAAFDYDACVAGKRFNIFGEWQHAWYPVDDNFSGYYKKTSSDDIHGGLSFNLNESLKLFAQYEWLRERVRNQSIGEGANNFHRLLFAGQYDLGQGVKLEAGYQHEWVRASDKTTMPVSIYKANSDMVYFGTTWKF